MVCPCTLNKPKLSFSGGIKKLMNPYTGYYGSYVQTVSRAVVDHQTTAIDTVGYASAITTEVQAQGYPNAFCDGIDIIEGTLSDTVVHSIQFPATATANGQYVILGPNSQPMQLLTVFLAVLFVIWKLLPVWILIVALFVLWAIYAILYPKLYLCTRPDGSTYECTEAEIVNQQNEKWWYVCPKDFYGIGERAKYASPSDVPQEQVALFNEHCQNAPDIRDRELQIWQWITYTALALGGIYIAVKVIPPLFTTKK